ncbi:MAG: 3-hydroxyacyl-CoA dehydrogenase NAD-binding domain-containing protein [Gammaproteobacteria bacterium]|nr:3-hydroxyacyl-CoA dehydrogenase NAD-binding domain-containing protein [Gammaproteobacteria bacterium]
MTHPDSPADLSGLQHWRLKTDASEIVWLCFDRQDAGANTLSAATMTELHSVLGELARKPPKGLVIYSGKDSGFIAGADIHEFPSLDSAERAFELTRQGQRVFQMLQDLPCPSVAVLNGFALGGGLELALACTWRIATAGSEPVFGLPEVQLGVHPGFGGTVRLPRLVGVRKAMDLMLTGRSIRPGEARAAGLVDALITDGDWRAVATRQLARPAPRRSLPLLDRLLALGPVRPVLARTLRQKTSAKAPAEHYPAPYAIIDLWEKRGATPVTAAYEAEARSFGQLVMTSTSRNLVRVFFLQERLKKLATAKTAIKRVHVVGAGIMGGDIAAWCALRGLDVTLQDREPRFIEPALARATKLFTRKLRTPEAIDAAIARLRADADGTGVATADLVIEAVFEDLKVKQEVYTRLEKSLRPGVVLATNTSSIPLEDLSGCLREPGRLIGMHFFNPVAKLPLVEIIAATGSAPEALATGIAFARQIGKLPVPCRSHPGFLVNRILAPYMGEAMELAREGVPLARIDQAATEFGMPMGPVELADSVGLDVAGHVARILAPVLGRSPAPEVDELVRQGHLGLKTGRGFYTYRDRKPVRPELDWGTADPVVQDRLIYAMLNEAAACLHDGIVSDPDLVDAGVIFGTGFAPFRGGPLHYACELGITRVETRLRELADLHGPRFKPSPGWAQLRN